MLSTRRLPPVLLALAVAGLAISLYLVATHYGDQPLVCGGVGDCGTVNSSAYASVGGVPVSLLGAGLYGLLAALALAWWVDPGDDRRAVLYWGAALSGFGYAMYLTYVELAVIHAICVWCVTSASILTVSLLLATVALLRDPDAEPSIAGPAPRHVTSRRHT